MLFYVSYDITIFLQLAIIGHIINYLIYWFTVCGFKCLTTIHILPPQSLSKYIKITDLTSGKAQRVDSLRSPSFLISKINIYDKIIGTTYRKAIY